MQFSCLGIVLNCMSFSFTTGPFWPSRKKPRYLFSRTLVASLKLTESGQLSQSINPILTPRLSASHRIHYIDRVTRCFVLIRVMKTTLMHCLSSVYFVNQPLHVSGIFVACHQDLHCIYRVSQEECARLRESVPYVKLYRYNPKHLYPKLNVYGDNGQRSLKL